MTVLLTNGTVGITESHVKVGESVSVKSHDENGNEITQYGIVEEILDINLINEAQEASWNRRFDRA